MRQLIVSFALFAGVCIGFPASAAGLHFQCEPGQQFAFAAALSDFLTEEAIPAEWVQIQSTKNGTASGHDETFRGGVRPRVQELSVALTGEMAKTSPVNQFADERFGLKDERFVLHVAGGGNRTVLTASRREILFGLLHPGRVTEAPCSIEALREHIGVRQSIAGWAERMQLGWPNGGPAKWQNKFWHKGTPKGSVVAALHDVFLNQQKYEVGCYTASKLAIAQGVLNYYSQPGHPERKETLAAIKTRLWSDGDPLVDIEPGAMWYFEEDITPQKMVTPGKLVNLLTNVAPENFIPGDWVYLLNTDKVSREKTGYEGSCAIYLGRGKFSDYYNDRNHFYTYLEKLDEVYQWRNGVFSRARDLHKVQPLTITEIRAMGVSPEEGGMVLSYRAVPKFTW